jgi:hypothetical protein
LNTETQRRWDGDEDDKGKEIMRFREDEEYEGKEIGK